MQGLPDEFSKLCARLSGTIDAVTIFFSPHHFLFNIFDRKLEQYIEADSMNYNIRRCEEANNPKKCEEYKENFAILGMSGATRLEYSHVFHRVDPHFEEFSYFSVYFQKILPCKGYRTVCKTTKNQNCLVAINRSRKKHRKTPKI